MGGGRAWRGGGEEGGRGGGGGGDTRTVSLSPDWKSARGYNADVTVWKLHDVDQSEWFWFSGDHHHAGSD